MSHPRVVIVVKGGLVTSVFADPDCPAINVMVLDYDNFSQGDEMTPEEIKVAESIQEGELNELY